MINIRVASTNPVKVEAVKQAFIRIFLNSDVSVEGVAIPSGVADQPRSDDETYKGASNRVEALSKTEEADYWVGIEGGVQEKDGEFEVFAWVIIKSKEEKYGRGRSSTFFLPKVIADELKNGKELAHACDTVFNETNSGQRQGAVGILTGNAIDRTQYYVEPTIMAFIPFKNPELY